jgi:hypothetical protein
MTVQTITKNPSGDLCQHGAYADLCITCHPEAIAKFGPQGTHDGTSYTEADWIERDNFDTDEQANGYAMYLARKHFATPYRIVVRDSRFVVEFVPEWNLR